MTMIRVFTIFCLLIYATPIFGSVNVTNYGAVGDLQTLVNINVVSNSTALVCPGASFSAVDIGKLIEVVGGGIFQTVSNDTLYAYITGPAASPGGCHNTSHSVHRWVQPLSESIVWNHVTAFAGGFI